ncbi:MAG: FecR domain-containing protein [Bacteroidia bacterium]|nr:FecR domain-containing protein [Bacteroidia bacterium]
MDHHKNEHIESELITRYLNGEASLDEVRSLETWLEHSEENATRFAEAKMLWIESQPGFFEDDTPSFEVDTDAAWDAMRERISTPEKPIRKLDFGWFLRVAAILVMGVSVVYMGYNYLNTGSKELSTVTTEEKQQVELADGSSIELNANSNLTYPKEFDGKTREVELQGEAFFDIERDTTKPFKIVANAVEINVLGTSFNVNANSADSVEVQVETGRVQMTFNGKSIILLAGETGVYNRVRDQLIKREKEILSSQFWRNRKLIFKRTRLPDVINALNTNYDVNIVLQGDKVRNKKINTRFEDQDIEVVLEIIANTLNLKVEHGENDTILLRHVED